MNLSETKEKLILFLQTNISEDELITNFDKQVEYLNEQFKKLANLKNDISVNHFLTNQFNELKNIKGTRGSIAVKTEKSSILTIVDVNFNAEDFRNLETLFAILLGISIEVPFYNFDYYNVPFKMSKMTEKDHFKFIGKFINCQGDLPEKDNSINTELCNSDEVTNENQKDYEYLDDLLDDENDNFYNSYDAGEIEDNYEGWEWDNWE